MNKLAVIVYTCGGQVTNFGDLPVLRIIAYALLIEVHRTECCP